MVEYNQELELIFLFVIIKQFDIGKIYHMDRLLPHRIKYIKFYNVMIHVLIMNAVHALFSIIGGEKKKKQIPVEIEYLILGFHKQKSSLRDSVSINRNRVLETRFLFMEIEYKILEFHWEIFFFFNRFCITPIYLLISGNLKQV